MTEEPGVQRLTLHASRRDARNLIRGYHPKGAAFLLASDPDRGPLAGVPTVEVELCVTLHELSPAFASPAARRAFEESGLDEEALLVAEPSGAKGYTVADVRKAGGS